LIVLERGRRAEDKERETERLTSGFSSQRLSKDYRNS